MKRTKIKEILQREDAEYEVLVQGWVRSVRNNQFVALNDGSTLSNLQIVLKEDTDEHFINHNFKKRGGG
jgi:asparaginyl-tRNA synthetase